MDIKLRLSIPVRNLSPYFYLYLLRILVYHKVDYMVNTGLEKELALIEERDIVH